MAVTTTKRFLAVLAACALLAPSLAHAQRVEYYHLDGLGSVRAITDEQGEVVERHDYLPFGEEWNPEPGSQPRKFTGKERDEETGWDYFGARYYEASLARFTAIDPVTTFEENRVDPQRWNRYAYVRNNPMRYVDPDGRDAVWVNHADGTATLVIPVQFSGADATKANVAAIVARANSVTVLDPNVSIQVISTDTPIEGKLNRLDFSPGLDNAMCGGVGECVNRLGGNRGHINSANGDGTDAAAHDIFHFAGIRDAYKEGPRDKQGGRTSEPLPGFTTSNIMTSRTGTELTARQAQEARRNRTTKTCTGGGAACK